eukprot:6270213-Pyramimonas_sp.AAC.1
MVLLPGLDHRKELLLARGTNPLSDGCSEETAVGISVNDGFSMPFQVADLQRRRRVDLVPAPSSIRVKSSAKAASRLAVDHRQPETALQIGRVDTHEVPLAPPVGQFLESRLHAALSGSARFRVRRFLRRGFWGRPLRHSLQGCRWRRLMRRHGCIVEEATFV